jgi:hypothetical protein
METTIVRYGAYASWQDAAGRDLINMLEDRLQHERRMGLGHMHCVNLQSAIDSLWESVRHNEARNRFIVRGVKPDEPMRDALPVAA